MNKRIKRIGIALLVVPSIQLIASIFSQVQAGETVFSSADNNLILTSSALVLLMTPGLAFFYGGFLGKKKCPKYNGHEFCNDGNSNNSLAYFWI